MTAFFIPDPQVPVEKPSVLIFPQWLTMESATFRPLFENMDILRKYYILFWMHQNPECQKALARFPIERLKHLIASVINAYGDCEASHKATLSQIDTLNEEWRSMITPLTSHMAIQDFYIRAICEIGRHADFVGDAGLKAMSEGSLDEDFLWKHPSTEKAFTSFILAKWASRSKEVK